MTRSLLLTALVTSTVASAAEWYEEMEIGPAWSDTFADIYQGKERVAAVKGLLLDLGDGQRALFDTETLRFVTAYEGGIQWGGTPWTGSHGPVPRLNNENDAHFNSSEGPGWADPSGSFDDKRPENDFTIYTGEGNKTVRSRYGNIGHGKFLGFHRNGSRIVLEYEVNGTRILDHLATEKGSLVRYFEIAPHPQPLTARIADAVDAELAVSAGATVESTDQGLLLRIPASTKPLLVSVTPGSTAAKPISLQDLAKPGPGLWKGTVDTKAEASKDKKGPWVVDTITLPESNPWKSNLRFGAFDFINADSAALSTWNGDVWVVSGLEKMGNLTWKRFASGLFQPLGLKVVNGTIYVNGRDQISKLHDLNNDGEADHYEVFNRDVTVSPNFHEFAFDLQTDKDGFFYFSKAAPVRPGGRGFDTILPHHGTVVRVSPDGTSSEVIATGLRAPGGLGVGPNGEVTTGENEGTWQPCCKINFMRADERPMFFGTEDARQDLKDAPYTPPLCYLPMDVDNSGGSQVWVPQGVKWGLKPGELIHLSYGQSSLYRVLPEKVGDTLQGGVVKIPVKIRSSAQRARFAEDSSLYVLGFRGWQTNAATESAFQRIRYTGEPVTIPGKIETTAKGLRLHFELPLDEELANDPTSYSAQRWDYVRGPQYGSGEFSVDQVDEEARKVALEKESKDNVKRDNVKIASAKLLDDGQTVELELEGHKPSMQLKLAWDLESEDGEILTGDLHSTIYDIPN